MTSPEFEAWWQTTNLAERRDAWRAWQAALDLIARTSPVIARHTGHPDYCPDDLSEDVPCPDCGASLENLLPCGAIHNGPRPRPLVELTVVKR